MEDFCSLNWSWYTIRNAKESLQYFDKTFDLDENDIFYCNLNEIEPHILLEKDTDSENESDSIPIDPRTAKIVNEIFIDNSERRENQETMEIFQNFQTKSLLTKNEHQTCLTALQSLNEKKEIRLQNLITKKRDEEMRLFNEFVKDYEIANPKQNNALRKLIIEKYKAELEFKANRILAEENTFYSLQTAMPFDEKNKICNFTKAQIQYQDGVVPVFDCFEFSKILRNRHLQPDYRHELTFVGRKSIELNEDIDVIIPETALHLLLSSSTLLDSWEIPLRIDPFENNCEKLICFDEPLPLRSQSDYICTRAFDNLVSHEMQLDTSTKWVSLTDNINFENSNCESMEAMEINAVNLEANYELFDCDDYLKQCANLTSEINQKKSNRILCKWSILNENEKQINLLTQTQAKCIENENGTSLLTNMSMKLEYKAEFGAEVMTKSELIHEWLRQYLLSSGITKRVRIDTRTSRAVLIQKMCLTDIESELMRLYSVRPCDFLGSFHSLLTIISNFPFGDYLLKFNPKYHNKLMVYSKTEKSVPNAVSLHELFENVLNKIDLLTASEFIPIDGNTITPMHQRHTILPSCFPYWIRTQRQVHSNSKSRISKKTNVKKKPKKANKKAKKVHKKQKNTASIGTDSINS